MSLTYGLVRRALRCYKGHVLISCEKCATTYNLDERMLPPQGAPVQCTKCQHVFLAKPQAAAAVAAPASASNQTMMFGAPPAATPGVGAGAGALPNQTMMFGAVSPQQVVPTASAGASPNQTMMFGAVHADGPAPQPAPPAKAAAPAAANQTMMFGAVHSPPAPAQPAAPSNPNQTMMFGAVQAPAPTTKPVGAAAPNQTMMFGAVQAPPAPTGGASNQTMMFGAVQAPPAAAKSAPAVTTHQTMMFGAISPQGVTGTTVGGAAANSESTVRMSHADLERMMKPGDVPAPAGSGAPVRGPAQTMLFAAGASSVVVDPGLRPAAVTERISDVSILDTLPPSSGGTPAIKPNAAGAAPGHNALLEFAEAAPTQSGGPPAVDLPPEPLSGLLGKHGRGASTTRDTSLDELQYQLERRNRRAVLLVAAAVGVVLLAFGVN